jgi:hypothetical protein
MMKIEIDLTDAQMAAIAAKVNATPTGSPVTGLRPGQVVVDVGTLGADDGPYTGTLNPDTPTP